MFKCTVIGRRYDEVTIEVVKTLEGFKVQSTLLTVEGKEMKMVSPDTWAHESRATQEARGWVNFQQDN